MAQGTHHHNSATKWETDEVTFRSVEGPTAQVYNLALVTSEINLENCRIACGHVVSSLKCISL
jgi:hypothetical protein